MPTSSLSVGTFGDDVAKLHEELRAHGFDLPSGEVQRAFFGPGTREAVRKCQLEHGLKATGEVDDETAVALKRALRNRKEHLAGDQPLLDVRTSDSVIKLSTNRDISNLQAKLLKLGLQIPQSELNTGELGFGTATALHRFKRKHGLQLTDEVNDAVLAALDDAASTINNVHEVVGRIYMDYGVPAANIEVRLYSTGFGGKASSPLKTSTTDELGYYTLKYDPAHVPSASVEVYVVDAKDQSKEYAVSNTLYKPEKTVRLNLIAPTEAKPLQDSEFSRLRKDVKGRLGRDVADLVAAEEKGDRQDIGYVSAETNWDARPVALASLAAKLSQDTGMTHEALYGIVRVGLPTDKDQLAQVGSDDVAKALEHARNAGIIGLNEGEQEKAVTDFQRYASGVRLDTKDYGSLSPYSEFLRGVGLSDEGRQQLFAAAYFAPRNDSTELWTNVAHQFSDLKEEERTRLIGDLKLQGKLAFLTANNAELSNDLQATIRSPQNLARLVDAGLYTPEAWDAKLKSMAGVTIDDDNAEALGALIPPAYIGESIADRKRAYIDDMASKVRMAYPEKVLRHMIKTDQVVLGDNHSEIKNNVNRFLEAAEPLGFKVGNVLPDKFAEEHRPVVFAGLNDDQASRTLEGVRLLHRVYQITPSDEAMQIVLSLGHKYAQDIVAVPEEYFVERFADVYMSRFKWTSRHEAILLGKLTYNKSHQVHSTTYTFFNAAQHMQQMPPVYAMTGPPEKRLEQQKQLAEKIQSYPNMQALFGSLDFCECEHCRSVLSPAAYLVDLLQFLDRKEKDWEYFTTKWRKDHGEEYTNKYAHPFEALTARRPDLANLPLTCANTNTALPYIDIVNEILEYYVVHKKLVADVAHDTGEATTPELLAEPQYIEPKAYSILKQAKYPLRLPFDLWLESVRQFCNHYDTPLWQVMDTLKPIQDTDFAVHTRVAVESLGISPAEYDILTNEDPLPQLSALYGYSDDANMLSDLKKAKQLSNRLGVTYKELLALLQTRFVNPNLDRLQLLHKIGVTVNDVFRYKEAAGFERFTPEESKAFKEKLANAKRAFGTDVETSIDEAWNQGVLKHILLLNDTNTGCNFDATTVGYADREASRLDWLRLNLFVRLWRRLGWKMDEMDRVLDVLMPRKLRAIVHDPSKPEAERAKVLGQAVGTTLINIAHLETLASHIDVGKNALIKLSTLWADIPTTGKKSLYARLFLARNIVTIDATFDDALGRYLHNSSVKLREHISAVQAALNLTVDEIELIIKDAASQLEKVPESEEISLTLKNVSLLYRYSLLAKGLKLSISELITLKQLSGLDPFKPLSEDLLTSNNDNHLLRQTLEFVDYIHKVTASSFSVEDLAYLFLHTFEATGKYRTVGDTTASTMNTLAEEIRRIQAEHAVPNNPNDNNDPTPFASITDEILQQKLGLALPAAVAEQFFAMWTGRQADNKEFFHANLADDKPHGFLSESQFEALFVPDATDADDRTKQNNLLRKRAILVRALLPFLQQKLIRQAVIQTLSAALGVDSVSTEWLISDASRLHDPKNSKQALIETFAKGNDVSEEHNVERAFTLLSKVSQLVQGFEWNDRELRYFITNDSDFGDVDFSILPVDAQNTSDAQDTSLVHARLLFKAFIRLCTYRELKRDLAGGGDDVIGIFEAAHQFDSTNADKAKLLYQRLADLTRRDIAVVESTAKHIASQTVNGILQLNYRVFADEQGVARLWRALQLVQLFGVAVQGLVNATQVTLKNLADEKYQAIAEDLKNVVKARYDIEAWQQVAQPIFNTLRQRKRDALVAHLLHTQQQLFGSVEEMYEYFLLDPGMEPVVQTSRIRLATATVQLFIQRCLLNLEHRWDKKVPPGAINAKHWQWMNRYRIWEANRKIFLFPENWLEPEWRDDKTHLFRELEGKLLQGDVSNDLVEDAFFDYLKKLEELARLDIVALYCEENETTPQANKLHVIGRTFGLPHKYFYRQYAQQMWTPWEPVEAEIDADHIVAVMWRGRLHLFWVTFVEKMPNDNKPAVTDDKKGKPLVELPANDVLALVNSGAENKIVEVHLHWSEYYQGTWTTRQSGDLTRPITKQLPLTTNTRDIVIHVTKEPDTKIDNTLDPAFRLDGAVRVHLSKFEKAFRVVSKNSPPEIVDADKPLDWPFNMTREVNHLKGDANSPLTVKYLHYLETKNGVELKNDSAPQTILGKAVGEYTLVPCSNPATMGGEELGKLVTPFFFQDNWHTFYVEPALTETITIDQWDEWVAGPPVVYQPWRPTLEKVIIEPFVPWPKELPVPLPSDPDWIDLRDPRIRFGPKIRKDWCTAPSTFVKFDARLVGSHGGLDLVVRPANFAENDGLLARPISIKDSRQIDNVIHSGSRLGDVVLVDPGASMKAVLADVTIGMPTGRRIIDVKSDSNVMLVGGAGVLSIDGAATFGRTAHRSEVFDAADAGFNTFNQLDIFMGGFR